MVSMMVLIKSKEAVEVIFPQDKETEASLMKLAVVVGCKVDFNDTAGAFVNYLVWGELTSKFLSHLTKSHRVVLTTNPSPNPN